MKYALSAMNIKVKPKAAIKPRSWDSTVFSESYPFLQRLHLKGQLRITKYIPFWQLQLQSSLLWLGGKEPTCPEKTGCEQLLSCVCESTRRPKVGNWKNAFWFYSWNWATGEICYRNSWTDPEILKACIVTGIYTENECCLLLVFPWDWTKLVIRQIKSVWSFVNVYRNP